MRTFVLLIFMAHLFSQDGTEGAPEKVDYDKIIGERQSTKDQVEEIDRIILKLKAIELRLINDYKEILDQEADKLMDESQASWELHAKSHALLLSDKYRDGTLRKVYHGEVLIKLHQKRIIDLMRFKSEYFDP
jgi:hypothetical protein